MSRRVGLRSMQGVGVAFGGPFLYAGTQSGSDPGTILKVRLSDLSVVDSLTLGSGEAPVSDMCTDDTYLYVILGTTPARVVRIELSTFTRVDYVDFDPGDDDGLCGDIIDTIFGTALFVGLGTSPGKLGTVVLSTFTYVGALDLDTGENNCISLTHDTNYIYATVQPSVGSAKTVRFDLTTFNRVDALELVANYVRYPQSTTIADGKLYVASWNLHVHLTKVDLATFTVEAELLDVDLGVVTLNVVKAVGNYLYVTDTGCNIIKVDLSTFSKVDVLTNSHSAVALVHNEGFLYVGTHADATPATIYKVNLSSFSIADSLNIAAAFGDITCLLYSAVG